MGEDKVKEIVEERVLVSNNKKVSSQFILFILVGLLLTVIAIAILQTHIEEINHRHADELAHQEAIGVVQYFGRVLVPAQAIVQSIMPGAIQQSQFEKICEVWLKASLDVWAISYGLGIWECSTWQPMASADGPWKRYLSIANSLGAAYEIALRQPGLAVVGPLPDRESKLYFVVIGKIADTRGGFSLLAVWVPLERFLAQTGFNKSVTYSGKKHRILCVSPISGEKYYLGGAPQIHESRLAQRQIDLYGSQLIVEVEASSIGIGSLYSTIGILGLVMSIGLGLWKWERIKRREEQIKELRVQSELNRQRKRFSTLINALPFPACIYKEDGRITYANSHFTGLLGGSLSSVLGHNLEEFFVFPRQEKTTFIGAHKITLRALQKGPTYNWYGNCLSLEAHERAEEYFGVCLEAVPSLDEIKHNITVEALSAQIAAFPEPILSVQDKLIVEANPAACRVIGIGSSQALKGKEVTDLFEPVLSDQTKSLEEIFEQAKTTVQWLPIKIKTRDGTRLGELGIAQMLNKQYELFIFHPAPSFWIKQPEILLVAYQQMAEELKSGEILTDINGSILWANEKAKELIEIKLGKNLFELLVEAGIESRGLSKVQQTFQAREYRGECILQFVDQNTKVLMLQWHPIKIVSQQTPTIRFVIMPIDLTHLNIQLEPHLASPTSEDLDSVAEWRDFLLDVFGGWIREIELSTGRIKWDSVFISQFGLDPSVLETDPNNWILKVHPNDRELVTKIFEKMCRGEFEGSIEYRIQRPSSEYVSLIETTRILKDKEGRPVRLLSIIREKPIQPIQSSDRLLVVAKQIIPICQRIQDPIWAQDKKGRLIFASEGWAHQVGLEIETSLGKEFKELFDIDTANCFQEWFEKAKLNEIPIHVAGLWHTNKGNFRIACKVAYLNINGDELMIGKIMGIAEEEVPPSSGQTQIHPTSSIEQLNEQIPSEAKIADEVHNTIQTSYAKEIAIDSSFASGELIDQTEDKWNPTKVMELLNISQEELIDRAEQFVNIAPTLLLRIIELMEEGTQEELTRVLQQLSKLAAQVEASNVRHAARTVELALEQNFPAINEYIDVLIKNTELTIAVIENWLKRR